MAMKGEIFVVEYVDLWLDFLSSISNKNMTAKRRG